MSTNQYFSFCLWMQLNNLALAFSYMILLNDVFALVPSKIGYEFNFLREADAMERIRHFLYKNNKKSPVLVPRTIRDMVTRYDCRIFPLVQLISNYMKAVYSVVQAIAQLFNIRMLLIKLFELSYAYMTNRNLDNRDCACF